MPSSVKKDEILHKVSKINSWIRGLNVVRLEKYFTHIILLFNLTTDKKVGLIKKSRGQMVHPRPMGFIFEISIVKRLHHKV